MKQFMIVSVCLLVGACMTAKSTLAAGPALFECAKLKKKEGHYIGMYNDKTCSEINSKGEGVYELRQWNAEAKKGKVKIFKGKSKGANLDVKGLGRVICTGISDTGQFTSPATAGDIVIIFKDCETFGIKCASGSTVGEVATTPLDAEFGYLAGEGSETPTVGIDLKAEAGQVLTKFHCNGIDFEVAGSVIGEVAPINELGKELTFTFGQREAGVQRWTKFEGQPEDILILGGCIECSNPLTEGELTQAAIEGSLPEKTERVMLKA